jgi:hypothetical protein
LDIHGQCFLHTNTCKRICPLWLISYDHTFCCWIYQLWSIFIQYNYSYSTPVYMTLRLLKWTWCIVKSVPLDVVCSSKAKGSPEKLESFQAHSTTGYQVSLRNEVTFCRGYSSLLCNSTIESRGQEDILQLSFLK